MNETLRFAARYAVATGVTALVVAIFRTSQPFLALLAAVILLGRPFAMREIPSRLIAIWSGVGTGIVVVSLFPQQPWLLFPAFAATLILAIRLAARSGETPNVFLAAMGLCASLPAGLVHPEEALHAGWDHGWNLTIGLLAVWGSFELFPAEKSGPGPASYPLRSAGFVAFVAVLAAWVAVIIAPGSSVVLVIAAATTALGTSQPGLPARLGQKTAGAVLGAALAIIFDSIVGGSGNSVSVFLVALMVIFAGLACGMRRWNAAAPGLAQCCAMFAVASPMLPAPDTSLAAMGGRIVAVLAGFTVAAGLYGLSRLAPSSPAPSASAARP